MENVKYNEWIKNINPKFRYPHGLFLLNGKDCSYYYVNGVICKIDKDGMVTAYYYSDAKKIPGFKCAHKIVSKFYLYLDYNYYQNQTQMVDKYQPLRTVDTNGWNYTNSSSSIPVYTTPEPFYYNSSATATTSSISFTNPYYYSTNTFFYTSLFGPGNNGSR